MQRSRLGTKYKSPVGLAVVRPYFPRKSLCPEAVDELPNLPSPTPIIHILPVESHCLYNLKIRNKFWVFLGIVMADQLYQLLKELAKLN